MPKAFVSSRLIMGGTRGPAVRQGALGECPERQRGGTVNPLRKLRRFESYFPHHALFEHDGSGRRRGIGCGVPRNFRSLRAGIAQW